MKPKIRFLAYFRDVQSRLPGEASAHSHMWEKQLQSGGAGNGKFGEMEIKFSVDRQKWFVVETPKGFVCVTHTSGLPPASAPPASPRTAAFYASALPLVSLLPQRPLSKGESFLKCTLSSIQHPCWAPSPPSLFKGWSSSPSWGLPGQQESWD